MKDSQLRIVVLGYVVRGPIGGMAWHHLQYVLGLIALGHEVWFIEDSDDYPSCYDPERGVTDHDPAYGLRFTKSAFDRLGLAGRWAFHDAFTSTWHGPAAPAAVRICETADVVLNLSGVNPLRPWLTEAPWRVLVDTDPAFTQIRHLTDEGARIRAAAHNRYFTFAGSIGSQTCGIPDDGFAWQPTRQPVALEVWPQTVGSRVAPFTTVMQWDSYATRSFDGVSYGMKSKSFEAFTTLPTRVSAPLQIALGSAHAPAEELADLGWDIVDPLAVTRDPWTYQSYIERSAAEFSVAKEGYVAAATGWFSERSCAYLASGRPVVVQDTGFSSWLESGDGIVPFNDLDEAISGIEHVRSRYRHHCRAALEIVEAEFEARSVLADLLAVTTSSGDRVDVR